ncbi:MAG: ATP-binding cassette domain-containing protein [Bacilli bacterium]|nr:ATP-binding cassette domain-containing protein [Bacilli bacterium]
MPLFTVNNLNYNIDDKIFFKEFNLGIEEQEFVSIIAPNQSGKTMLTKLLCAIIPTYDMFILNDISLNKENVLEYIEEIGIVTNDIKKPFLYKKVREELEYPLENLGYSNYKINRLINNISEFFEIEDLLNKNIDSLSQSDQSKLLIILALVHKPKLLVLDDAFNNMDEDTREFMLKRLYNLTENGLTVLNITSNLNTIYKSDRILVMKDFKIEKEGSVEEILKQDSYLTKIGLSIPIVVELSLKLMSYDLLDKIYFNMEELESSLW